MSTVDPYVEAHPGGLITAELFNEIQRQARIDIDRQIQKLKAELKRVDQSGNADKLAGKSPEELAADIVARALAELPRRTGYRRVFKRLRIARPGDVEYSEIKHGLRSFPLVDVYQLDYFPVMCRADSESDLAWVNFFLLHTSEKRIGRPSPVQIQASSGPVFRIPFAEALAEYEVRYTDESSLADLVNEFWKKLFSGLNDEFDERQFCHSPWFNRCCDDDRTVAEIRRAGDWDDLWLKLKPRKTINYPRGMVNSDGMQQAAPGVAVPPDIEVVHFDLDTVGIRVIPPRSTQLQTNTNQPPINQVDDRARQPDLKGKSDDPAIKAFGDIAADELKVMVLLQAGAPAVGSHSGGGHEGGSYGGGGGHTHGY
jgi:hypothetical protein